ncbi:MAG: hypothetical protein JW864_13175 [Spirochaetes bacterium]|nr:hypothetical protein [Spirochaetota bacterium]
MNISSSISQVIYQTQLPGRIMLKKAYMWPEYNAGSVEKIQPAGKRAESFNYIKRSSYDPAHDLSQFNTSDHVEYNLKGHTQPSNLTITPGMLFEAFA